jgi:hypothetical protein
MIHDALHQTIHQHIDKYIAPNPHVLYLNITTNRSIHKQGYSHNTDINLTWEVKSSHLAIAESLILRTAKWKQLIKPRVTDYYKMKPNNFTEDLPEIDVAATRHLDINNQRLEFNSVGYRLQIELSDPQLLEKLEQIFQNEQGIGKDLERLRPISSKEQSDPNTTNLWDLVKSGTTE